MSEFLDAEAREKPKGTVRGLSWCITINNPTELDGLAFWTAKKQEMEASYVVAQLEKGEEEETPHYQAYVHFKTQKSFNQLKKWFPRAHLEKAKGSPQQNRDYCTKEGRVDGPWELGDCPQKGRRMDLEALQRDLDEGKSIANIRSEHFPAYMRYSRAILDYRLMTAKRRDWAMQIICLWGPTGTGKSRYCHETWPGAYWKTKNSGTMQFWDGYAGEEVIIVDEFYGWLTFDFMLRFLDRYPCNLEVKHGTVPISAKTIVFTSNKHPREWYPNSRYQWDELNPLKRRLNEIIEFPRAPSTPPLSNETDLPQPDGGSGLRQLAGSNTGDQSEELRLINLYMQQ